MEKLQIKSKWLIVLFLMTLTLVESCSEDDDPSADNFFLEIFDGTYWKMEEPEGIIFLRFNNNELNPIELWLTLIEEHCYLYSASLDEGSIRILKSSANRLEIMTSETAQDYSILTISVVGETIQLKDDYYVGGILDESSGTLTFNKASLDLGELEMCNFEVLNKKNVFK